jgi:hypothetical protein
LARALENRWFGADRGEIGSRRLNRVRAALQRDPAVSRIILGEIRRRIEPRRSERRRTMNIPVSTRDLRLHDDADALAKIRPLWIRTNGGGSTPPGARRPGTPDVSRE